MIDMQDPEPKATRHPDCRFAHVNLVAENWRHLASFYQDVFGCVPVPPERDLRGDWLDRATAIPGAHITRIHLRLPGFGDAGPTLEIFEYSDRAERPPKAVNASGFAHLAFSVENVEAAARQVIEQSGSAIGELTEREIPGVGSLTFSTSPIPRETQSRFSAGRAAPDQTRAPVAVSPVRALRSLS